MNPQHIVYIGLVLVGLGITICAIDPLKPEIELKIMADYENEMLRFIVMDGGYIDIDKTLEVNPDVKEILFVRNSTDNRYYWKLVLKEECPDNYQRLAVGYQDGKLRYRCSLIMQESDCSDSEYYLRNSMTCISKKIDFECGDKYFIDSTCHKKAIQDLGNGEFER